MINMDTCIVNNITQSKVYDRPTVGRSSAEWRPISGVWLPTVLWYNVIDRPSGHRRPIDARWSGDRRPISWWKKSLKCRPIVGRSSGDHRPTLHRWQNPWKSADRSMKLLTWVLRQKSRRSTKKFAKIGADVGRQSADNRPTSPDFRIFGSPTVGRPSVWLMWL